MRRLDLEGELRSAIESGALEVGYQPIVQAATGRIVGFEALCRWPAGEPAEVLAMAEETGLLVPLGRQVLRPRARSSPSGASCPRGAGLTWASTSRARQLGEPGFVRMLARNARRDRSRPARAAARGLRARPEPRARDDAIRRVLEQALEQLGVRTHIDDFGTGASPLRLLHRFPGDAIKIHRALVTGIGRDAGAFEIVRRSSGSRTTSGSR